MNKSRTHHRLKVRARFPLCVEGSVEHMTVDEILERSLDTGGDLSCPACGQIHLSREEIKRSEMERIVKSTRYQQLQEQALSPGR